MTLLFNALAILFFLSMLAFGVGVCVMMVRNHGQQMLAALMGQPFALETGSGAEIFRIEPRVGQFIVPGFDSSSGFDWRDDDDLPLAA